MSAMPFPGEERELALQIAAVNGKISAQPGTLCYHTVECHCKVAIRRVNCSPLLFSDLCPVSLDGWTESYFSHHHYIGRVKGFV